MKVRVTKRARAQIDRADLWWEQNRPLAPGALDEELVDAFSLLSAEPGLGATVLNARTEGVRRVHLARVHYHLYFVSAEAKLKYLRFGIRVVASDPHSSRLA